MTRATDPPSSFRSMSTQLFVELMALLQKGEHIAILAARHSGKALVLYELRRLAALLEDADKPHVVLLRLLDCGTDSEPEFLDKLCQHLEINPAELIGHEELPLAAKIVVLLRASLSARRVPLWLFLQNITEANGPLARGLLTALQEAFADPEMQGRLSAVITGSQEFVPLTYQENSPFRHARKFFLRGFDRELTRRFFRARIVGHSLSDGFLDAPGGKNTILTEEALDLLYQKTGGYARFIEEIVLTANRPGTAAESTGRNEEWSAERIERLVEKFLKEHVMFEPYCKLSLRDVERDHEAWDLLQTLFFSRQPIKLSSRQPHLLETSGIARRKEGGEVVISSPMWERFLKDLLGPRRRADVYARLGEWETAWELYAQTDASDCDRPLDGEERYMLDRVIGDWTDSLVDYGARGADEVVSFFLEGVRHLFGFHTAILSDRATDQVIRQYSLEDSSVSLQGSAATTIDDPEVKLRLFPGRLTLETSPKKNPLANLVEFDPLLRLTRGEGKEIDTATIRRLRRSLHRFWHAFLIARRTEYDATLGDIRDKHLQVVARVSDLLSLHPGDMQQVVEGTVDALIDIAGYFRILICMVSPNGDRIQAVAGRCLEPHLGFNFPTDYLLDRNSPESQWDIQQWVAIKGTTETVPDAISPEQVNPKTNQAGQLIEMEAITVVPLKLERQNGHLDEILGTIHFERIDKQLPSDAELRSFEILAGQVAVAFDQARRLTMLERALQVLEDQFRILAPDGRVVFRNDAAAKADGITENELWQFPISSADEATDTKHAKREVIDDAREKKGGVHRYVKQDRRGRRHPRAWDEFAAPLSDFRSRLTGVFESDGMLGYVHLTHKLTDLIEMHEALQHWLGLNDTRKTAQKILEYFHRLRFKWCRIYLFRGHERTRQYLESFEEFGLSDASVAEAFRGGQFRVERDIPDQQAWFLIDEHQQLAVFRYDPTLTTGPVFDADLGRGIPTIRTKDNWREEFGKKDDMWIEAPLIVGDEIIGLIALSKPDEFPPQWYEKLRWCVVSVAFALQNSLHAEQEITLQREEAWQSAAQLAIHQLSNKLVPVESSCHFVQDWLAAQSLKHDAEYDDAIELLTSAQQGIKWSRQILKDFRRYATDEPFSDIRDHSVATLLSQIEHQLRWTNANVDLRVQSVSPELKVRASRSAILEVFEVLFNNSLMHAGKSSDELHVTLSAKMIEPGAGQSADTPQSCCLFYEDDGCGVPETVRPRIFDPFFSTEQQGNGLGLAIARRFLRRQLGWITEEGTEQSGARFCIYLPAAGSVVEEVSYA